MVHGTWGAYAGVVPANNRLGIPAIHLQDGPQGVGDNVEEVTCWPSALTVAASWDPEMMHAFASAMAVEQKTKGTNVLLGPMVNIARVPQAGRNFESMGEDPYFAAIMGAANIQGIQSQGILGCLKHWALNDQEQDRADIDVNVDERTAHELYFPAFEAAIKAGVGTVMCSYNKVNGTYVCENKALLTRELRDRMGFQGWVMSDWYATHSSTTAALAGLDQEMPGFGYFGTRLSDDIKNGIVRQAPPPGHTQTHTGHLICRPK
ncbi:putative Thermostable beta-glucosidase B [Paratrimastix pyriformis]|uniref:beta-glucosidase n=1 Tax=Paratrimastix pyriformis TaxID=342808 RepID=A0ABQ8UF11_9EUKA|nr:putative Thermostable beta-glucosidase B [Paratrimastix pyriformis]